MMKKHFILPALMAGLVMFSSCSEKDNKDDNDNTATSGQRLEKITCFEEGYSSKTRVTTMAWDGDRLQSVTETRPESGDEVHWNFNYSGNKLSTMEYYRGDVLRATYQLSYNGDNPTEVTETRAESGSSTRYTIGYNSNGEMTSVKCIKGKDMGNNEVANLTWQNGNVTKVQRVRESGTKTWNYTYDNKMSGYTGMGVAVFTIIDEIYDGGVYYLSKNNVLTEQRIDSNGETSTEQYTYTYDGDYPLTCRAGITSWYLKYVGKSDPAPAY